ncbi:twin-arginine translocase TatA/TatE family subunit [Lederbergia sp. NSJ-179]|uniref:twin-arginine translocase TatA/TatE family subunit n=1 Tax=Lederbergia sp. NSJ-179 TaxID=2931402 RepID=UPI001FD5B229|nr:twin-arginine translocase TatA/TatE family subunit [Lederbergia sp. NSJ-179]MCJ7840929.1 twin-arginine translocase TatA/TatE family subunit [Lederbergia sp. NSJ-179]
MFFQQIGVPGLIIILIITLIVFGPKKLPEIGAAFGKTLSEFKKSANEIMGADEAEKQTKNNSVEVIQPASESTKE